MAGNLIFTDVDGDTYNFPETFGINEDGWTSRENVLPKGYYPGGFEIGDGLPDTKVIQISGYLVTAGTSNFETEIRGLQKALRKGGQLSYSDDVVSRYIDIDKTLSVGKTTIRMNEIVEFNITLQALFPYWQDTSLTSVTFTMTSSPQSFNLTFTSSDDFYYPVITITNNADNSSLSLTNVVDSSAKMEYNDASFVNGDILIIDGQEGTVERNGVNTIEDFTPPYLRLMPDTNQLIYEGAACEIKFEYRNLYL